MRIAQIAPLHEAVPPKLYGGTERVVSYLTEELVALGGVRRAALPSRLLAILDVQPAAGPVRHDAAWATRPSRAATDIQRLSQRAGRLDQQFPAAGAPAGAVRSHRAARGARAELGVAAAGHADLPCISRPHCAGEGGRTEQFGSRVLAASRSRSPPRWTRPTSITSMRSSGRCSIRQASR